MREVWFPGLGIDKFKIDPVAFSIGNISVAWYSLIIATGMILAVLYVWFRFKENGLSVDDLLDFVLFVIPSGIVGARLYYVIFSFEHYKHNLLEIFAIWKGGLGIYGGIIAGAIAALLVARHKKINLLKVFDMLAPAVMMAQAIGRWGNFMNVEAFGGPTTLPWRMCGRRITENFIYKGLIDVKDVGLLESGEIGAHPTFLYESLWNIIGFIAIYFLFVRCKKLHKINGQIFYSYLIWYGLGRFWIEGLRSDSLYLVKDVIRVSQLVALLSFIAGVGLMIYGLVRYKKTGAGAVYAVQVTDTATDAQTTDKAKEGDKTNGTNNQRKRSGSKGKRKNKK